MCPILSFCPTLLSYPLTQVLEYVLFYLSVLLFNLNLWTDSRMFHIHFICHCFYLSFDRFLRFVIYLLSVLLLFFVLKSDSRICPVNIICPELLVLNQPSPNFSTLFYCSVTNTIPNKMTIKDKQKNNFCLNCLKHCLIQAAFSRGIQAQTIQPD